MNRRNVGRGAPRREHGGIRSIKMQELDRDQEAARNRQAGGGLEWKRIDLHLHTPASSDYRDPGISYLDILKKAEEKNLDMIAFTDHNTVAGYAAMHREIETLTLLERLGRMTDVERETLSEYRRLLAKIVVLPGFEFTATFGFHVLGIFPENTSVRKLEYLLLNLNVPEEKMLIGAPDAGSTSDVLTAYAAITQGGGLAIAAHANSSNGVAMQGFPFGGQTKIAYTQDPNLVALEVTDMEVTGRRTTASFYNGSKSEYPRRMHILQGSDAHSLNTEQSDSMNKRLGVGARITEVLVKDASFAALRELLQGNDFTRIRPYRAGMGWESVEKARLEGPTLVQSFHERAFTPTSRARPILHDIVAFSNAGGGTIYVGANPDRNVPIHGIERPEEAIRMLKEDMRRTIEPPVEPDFTVRGGSDRGVLVINVPKGDDAPYAFTPTGQIYIRLDGESVVANRDEVVTLVLDAARAGMARVGQAAGMAISAPTPARPAVEAPGTGQKRAAQSTTASDLGEPMSPAQPTGRAVPVPAQPSQGSPPPPQPRRDERERRDTREKESRESRAQTPPPDRTARPPVFANLPPEKLKGQIRPMAPSTSNVPLLAPPSSDGQPPADGADAPLAQPAGVEAVVQAPAEAQALPAPAEPVAEVTAEAPQKGARSSRGRSRRKGAEVATTPEAAPETGPEAAPVAEAGAELEIDTPMEATVSAEHLTREELVAAEPEPPARGRSRKRNKKLEVDAPTAAAAETAAAETAILVQAEVEPGAQIPAELPPQVVAPELSSPAPASRRKGRGKTAAQKAAEQEAAPTEETPPAALAPEAAATLGAATAEAPAEAPARSRSRRGRKAAELEQAPEQDAAPVAVSAAPEAPPKPTRGSKQPVQPQAQVQAQAQAQAQTHPSVPAPPTTGVEIISTEERNGILYHTMRDLRNPASVVHNVTRKSARRLWLYAIIQHEHGDPTPAELAWHPNGVLGLWRREHRAGASRYDLAARYPDGSMRIFFGVTDEGLSGPWRELIHLAENADYWGPPPVDK